MSTISRSTQGPSWLIDLEYELWEWVVEPRSPEERQEGQRLEALANEADGWWALDDAGEQEFVSLDEWCQRFKARRS